MLHGEGMRDGSRWTRKTPQSLQYPTSNCAISDVSDPSPNE
jgi:hypothetical protein